MQEKEITIDSVDLRDFFGPQNEKLKFIEKHFSKIKVIARGNTLKVLGEQKEIELFEAKLEQLVAHFIRYSGLTENQIERVLSEEGDEVSNSDHKDDVLVFGNRGLKIKARIPRPCGDSHQKQERSNR